MGGVSNKAFARLENKKQYNSIEHTTDLDLNQYDAFFRNLDPQIGRFIQIDPETESQENVSPFESMGNNPILNVDPLGDFKTRFGAWWHSLWHGGTVGKNSNGEYFVSKPIEHIKNKIEETKAKRKENPSKAYDLGRSLFESESEKINTIQSILGKSNIQFTSISDKLSDEILQCGIVYFVWRFGNASQGFNFWTKIQKIFVTKIIERLRSCSISNKIVFV